MSWSLDRRASGSWWAVVRQAETGAPETLARVQAGGATRFEYLDPAPLARASYWIRRECLDSRFAENSPATVWSAQSRGLHIAPLYQPSVDGRIVLEISGASRALLLVRIYDVQGRLWWARRVKTADLQDGATVLRVDSTDVRLSPGIYLATVRDEGTGSSDAAKLVILR